MYIKLDLDIELTLANFFLSHNTPYTIHDSMYVRPEIKKVVVNCVCGVREDQT